MCPDARQLVTIALAQTPVSVEISRNLHHITTMMRKASAAGADLVQFTEGALSGYGRKVLTPFEQWRREDWERLRRASDKVAELAGETPAMGSAWQRPSAGRRTSPSQLPLSDRAGRKGADAIRQALLLAR